MAWASVELVVNVEARPNPAPTRLPDRLLDDASLAFSHQHRLFLLAIDIHGNTVRLCRFDRAGAVVSAPFDFVDNPTILATFLYHFSRLPPVQRGHDPTVSLASDTEAQFFRKLYSRYSTIGSDFVLERGLRKAATPGWPIYALDIHGPWSEPDTFLNLAASGTWQQASHRCLVGRPSFLTGTPTGRGTKGFVAYDLHDEKVVYIKDSWRALTEAGSTPGELDKYQMLYRSGLTPELGLLTLRCGGDVVWPIPEAPDGLEASPSPPFESGRSTSSIESKPQTTFTQEHVKVTAGGSSRPLPRRHTRLVFKEVCRTLKEFVNAEELVTAVGMALSVHRDAWNHAHLLHGDISVGNILIYDLPVSDTPSDSDADSDSGAGEQSGSGDAIMIRGILSDWDLSRTRTQLSPGNQQATPPDGRSGTWQSLSALLQCYPDKPYELSDDLESFVHVLNWCTLRYLQHGSSGERNKGMLTTMFSRVYDQRAYVGPGPVSPSQSRLICHYNTKFSHISSGRAFVTGLPEERTNPLAHLLKHLSQLCKEHYESDHIRKYWKDPPSSEGAKPKEPPQKQRPRTLLDRINQNPTGPVAYASMQQISSTPEKLGSPNTPAKSPFEDHTRTMQIFILVVGNPELKWPASGYDRLRDQITSMKNASEVTGSTRSSDVYSQESDDARPTKRRARAPPGRQSPLAGPSRHGTPGSSTSPSPSGSRSASLMREGSQPGSRPGSVPPHRPSRLGNVAVPELASMHIRDAPIPPPPPAPSKPRGRRTQATPAATSQGKRKSKGKSKAKDVECCAH